MKKLAKLSDQELIRNYLAGDEASFEVLLKKYKDRIFSYLMSIVKNRKAAEDIFQDAFFKIIKT